MTWFFMFKSFLCCDNLFQGDVRLRNVRQLHNYPISPQASSLSNGGPLNRKIPVEINKQVYF